MIKTLVPYPTTTTSRTAEILSRYRPIAPKPDTTTPSTDHDPSSSMSQKISQSPYLRNLWPQLQARPTRTRKRGRTAAAALSATALKRPRPAAHNVLSFSSSATNHVITSLSFPSIAPADKNGLVTLPLLPCSPEISCMEVKAKEIDDKGVTIDLNKAIEIPEEKDLLQQLQQAPEKAIRTVIARPQPVRPVGSTITIECINEAKNPIPNSNAVRATRKPEEVEEEVEAEALPAVVSDSNNRVRLANSAYKKMVGQPECLWLEFTGDSSCRRICGEVRMNFCGDLRVRECLDEFTCWARIEWGRDEESDKKSADAFCEVVRLFCGRSKDYLYKWRFHVDSGREREASQSSCNV